MRVRRRRVATAVVTVGPVAALPLGTYRVSVACFHGRATRNVAERDAQAAIDDLVGSLACACRPIRSCDSCWGMRYLTDLVADGRLKVRCAAGCEARPLRERKFLDDHGRVIRGVDVTEARMG